MLNWCYLPSFWWLLNQIIFVTDRTFFQQESVIFPLKPFLFFNIIPFIDTVWIFFFSGYQVCHLQPNYTNIFTYISFGNKSICYSVCDKDVITIQKFTSGRCAWSFRIAAPQLIDWHWSFLLEGKKVFFRIHKHIF